MYIYLRSSRINLAENVCTLKKYFTLIKFSFDKRLIVKFSTKFFLLFYISEHDDLRRQKTIQDIFINYKIMEI
jgi:hypothetical protein